MLFLMPARIFLPLIILSLSKCLLLNEFFTTLFCASALFFARCCRPVGAGAELVFAKAVVK